MAKAKRYTAEQLRDAEKMAATLANVPEEKRTLVIMMTNTILREQTADRFFFNPMENLSQTAGPSQA